MDLTEIKQSLKIDIDTDNDSIIRIVGLLTSSNFGLEHIYCILEELSRLANYINLLEER